MVVQTENKKTQQKLKTKGRCGNIILEIKTITTFNW